MGSTAIHCRMGAVLATMVLLVTPTVAKQPLTVADALQTTRFAHSDFNDEVSNSPPEILPSPNGSRYVLPLFTGDLRRDGVRVAIRVGSFAPFATVASPRLVANLFTRAFEKVPIYRELLDEDANRIVWTDERHIALRWEDAHDVAQVVAIDVDTRRMQFVTHHATDVAFFSFGPGGKVLYAAASRPSRPKVTTGPLGGRYVESTDGFSLADGNLSAGGLLDRMYDRDLTLLDQQTGREVQLDIRVRTPGMGFYFAPIWSPDAKHVIVKAWPGPVPESWRPYTRSHVNYLDQFMRAAYDEPDSMDSKEVTQLFVVDTDSGRSRALWNAPTNHATRPVVTGAWSPDGRRVVVGPTVMPLELVPRGADVGGTAVAVVNVGSGQAVRLPLDATDQLDLEEITWLAADALQVVTKSQTLQLREAGGQWKLLGRTSRESPGSGGAVTVRVEQDPNTPPRLYAVDAGGRHKLLLDPNPALLDRYELGRVEPFQAVNPARTPGSLYYPVHYAPGVRYPLVIEVTGGFPLFNHFNLYGSANGLGPSQSLYVAQQLANRDIAVLVLRRIPVYGPEEADENAALYESSVRTLQSRGLIDPAKVALIGESRPGWLVSQAITHSDFPYAAAIVSDAADSGYFSGLMLPGNIDRENGGPPFGVGLEKWLERAPGFAPERIRTPLRLENESFGNSGVLVYWELFSRLRRLQLPVEYYLAPDIGRGSHKCQNPHQLLAVKQGAVDWLDFWLTGREDPDSVKADQYSRWRRLRVLRDASLKIVRPPQLRWTATPVPATPPY